MSIRKLEVEQKHTVNSECVTRKMTAEEMKEAGKIKRNFSVYDESIDFLKNNAYKASKRRRDR